MTLKLKILILSLFISINTFSQERKIIGRILDAETQKPIKDANIVILGTTSGTYSNQLGFFELTIDPLKHKTLVASHVGFKTSEVFIPTDDRFRFFLNKENIVLNKLDLNLYPKVDLKEIKIETLDTKNNNNLTVLETEAVFPYGIDYFYDIIGNSLASQFSHATGNSFNITFTINDKGEAVDITTSDSKEQTKLAVIQAFQKIPNWIPATQRQNKVSQYFLLPVVQGNMPDYKSLNLQDFYYFIAREIKYPAQARKMGVEGELIIELQFDNDGKLINTKVLKDIGADCAAEVKKVLADLPLVLTKSLVEKSKFNKFILPFCFGLEEPFTQQQFVESTDALVLGKIDVFAFSVIREVRVASIREVRSSGFPPYISPRIPLQKSSNFQSEHTYENIDFAAEEPKLVKRLSLINNSLNAFPPQIFNFSNLEYLDLEKNQLQTWPGEIDRLTNLKELYLSDNQLWTVPSNFSNLRKLEIIGLANNQFREFPSQLIPMEKLEVIDLSDNQITSIPNEIGMMQHLKVLILRNNNLSTIPKDFYNLKKLELLIITGNPIESTEIKFLKSSLKKTEIIH